MKTCTKEWIHSPAGKYSSYFRMAKVRNLDFELNFEDFMEMWQSKCFYCGDILETIGVDRVNNEKGYSKENCVACCMWCNRMKMDHSIEDFFIQVAKIYKFRKECYPDIVDEPNKTHL